MDASNVQYDAPGVFSLFSRGRVLGKTLFSLCCAKLEYVVLVGDSGDLDTVQVDDPGQSGSTLFFFQSWLD